MKQNITEVQFNQLSTKAKEKLIKWSKTCKSFQEEILEGDYNPDIPLLSIGQMIEFLPQQELDLALCLSWSRRAKWEKNKLCSVLWEYTRKVLEK